MSVPKILVIPGSLGAQSYNVRIAALATKELTIADADVTRISLIDYPLPIYDADLAAQSEPPQNAVRLKQLMCAHHGVFLASPEYNASISPLMKNTIDWISLVRDHGEPAYAAFKGRVFAIGAAANGGLGGLRSLMALRQILELGCGALVIPEQVAVARADQAFDEMDNLNDESLATALKAAMRRLVELASVMA